MASRRTRIKGLVANIPQRRKVIPKDEDPVVVDVQESTESYFEDTKTKNITDTVLGNESESNKVSLCQPEHSSELVHAEIQECNKPSCITLGKSVSSELADKSCVISITKSLDTKTIAHEPCNSKDESHIDKTNSVTVQNVLTDNKNSSSNFVNDNLLIESKPPITIKPEHSNNVKVINQVVLSPTKSVTETAKISGPSNKNQECEMTLNEVNLVANKTCNSVAVPPEDKGPKKYIPETSWGFYSDKDYPPPPPSPSKFNRSRIKAVPRFSQRKTSFSASESEDESRRHNRIRNDSVSSITGGNASETISEAMSPQQRTRKDSIKVMQKKVNRTEQYRKLAEARREFHKRFGGQNPDKQRLKMIDLIFYNPTTNPMSRRTQKESEIVKSEKIEEEKVDDPEDVKKEEKPVKEIESDEENELPVPQIKIGPTGEIILDEQSLVIERKEITQAKEDMQKSALVDGDFDTGYGIYKKVKRSKDWGQQETLRFYKALNVIGTDFSLMCELFPKRTRRELKMKFKKEEKLNQHLVDRAVMEPCKFDYAELKQEVELQEKELAEIQKIKEDEAKKNKERKAESAAIRKRKLAQKLEKSDLENIRRKSQETTVQKDEYVPPKKVKKAKPLTINSVLPDSDADESDVDSQSSSESEGEVIVPLKPTRSGRVPKNLLKLREVEKNERQSTISNIIKKTRTLSTCSNISTTSTDHLIPGSIMIVPEEDGNPQNPAYRIYMVTPDKTLTPLEVDSETVSKAIKFKESEERAKSQTEVNITIPAGDDTVVEICKRKNNEVQSNSDTNNIVFEYVDIPSENGDTEDTHVSVSSSVENTTNVIKEPKERTLILPAKVREKLHRNTLDRE